MTAENATIRDPLEDGEGGWQAALELLAQGCRSESAREALCLLASSPPARRLLEIADAASLGQAVAAHAPNHARLCIRRLSPTLYAIESPPP